MFHVLLTRCFSCFAELEYEFVTDTTMLLILSIAISFHMLTLSVLQSTIALSPPPLLMHPMREIPPLVPYALVILLLRMLTEFWSS
jgi:hypothetical protein